MFLLCLKQYWINFKPVQTCSFRKFRQEDLEKIPSPEMQLFLSQSCRLIERQKAHQFLGKGRIWKTMLQVAHLPICTVFWNWFVSGKLSTLSPLACELSLKPILSVIQHIAQLYHKYEGYLEISPDGLLREYNNIFTNHLYCYWTYAPYTTFR